MLATPLVIVAVRGAVVALVVVVRVVALAQEARVVAQEVQVRVVDLVRAAMPQVVAVLTVQVLAVAVVQVEVVQVEVVGAEALKPTLQGVLAPQVTQQHLVVPKRPQPKATRKLTAGAGAAQAILARVVLQTKARQGQLRAVLHQAAMHPMPTKKPA